MMDNSLAGKMPALRKSINLHKLDAPFCLVDWAGKMRTPQEFQVIKFAFLSLACHCD
jgi:hypothetical protein